jgi:hypothetical protein
MDQKPIVLYLRMKGIALDDIHNDLVRTLGKDAVAYSTVRAITGIFTGIDQEVLLNVFETGLNQI